jgi:pyruvate formate lyase activating enzyme
MSSRDDALIRCELCPKECALGPWQRGDCRVRISDGEKLVTLVYGKPCAVHVDPIEKKPMFHFLPGSGSFSIATAGCNLHCKYCQNWDISQSNAEDTSNADVPPEKAVALARRYDCASIAYTYSEPIVFYEYAYDTAALAKSEGIKNIMVTAGFINEKPLRQLCKVIDGANVDLKGFAEDFYRDVCSGRLDVVLRTLEIMAEEGVMTEITNLVVPTLNDDPEMIRKMCRWIVDALGPDVPMHFSRFHPMYQLKGLHPTPPDTLLGAAAIASDEGLNYVYVGNLPGTEWENTTCPGCRKVLIRRRGYRVLELNMDDGHCKFCGETIRGVWSLRRSEPEVP